MVVHWVFNHIYNFVYLVQQLNRKNESESIMISKLSANAHKNRYLDIAPCKFFCEFEYFDISNAISLAIL